MTISLISLRSSKAVQVKGQALMYVGVHVCTKQYTFTTEYCGQISLLILDSYITRMTCMSITH